MLLTLTSSGVDTAKLINPKPGSLSHIDLGFRSLEMGENYSALATEDRQFIIRKHCFLNRIYFLKQFWIHRKIEQKVEMLHIHAAFNIFF